MFALLAAVGFVCLIVVGAVVPETLRAIVGNGSGRSRFPSLVQLIQKSRNRKRTDFDAQITKANDITVAPTRRPIKLTQSLLFYLEADTLCVLIHYGLQFGVSMSVSIALSTLFQSAYGLNEIQTGLALLSRQVGAVLGVIVHSRILDRQYSRVSRQYNEPSRTDRDQDNSRMLKMREANYVAPDFPIFQARLGHIWHEIVLTQIITVVCGWCIYIKAHLSIILALQLVCKSDGMFGK